MVQKLRVVVRVDLDAQLARIKVLGKVDLHTVVALYSLIRRTSAIRPHLTVEVDLRNASAEAAVLEGLHGCSAAGHLPEQADPALSSCRLRVLDPVAVLPQAGEPARLSA